MRAAGRQALGTDAARFSPAVAAGRPVPWWGVLSAAAALVFLVGGCAVATALQPPSFNWLASTVSTLTEREVVDPWVMTAAFAVTGACEMATAMALRPAAMTGRLILAAAVRCRRAGRREPRARRRLTRARAVGRRYLHGPDRLADRSMATRTLGALGTAPSNIRRRRRDAPGPIRLVPHGTDHQRRNDRTGRAGHGHGGSRLAAGSRVVLPAGWPGMRAGPTTR